MLTNHFCPLSKPVKPKFLFDKCFAIKIDKKDKNDFINLYREAFIYFYLHLFRVAYSTGFSDHGNFYLSRIGHFVLYFFRYFV